MVVILQRDKCIGCNYCKEMAPDYFTMSQKDGKSILLQSREKKGFHSVKLPTDRDAERLRKTASVCPVRIIQVNEHKK